MKEAIVIVICTMCLLTSLVNRSSIKIEEAKAIDSLEKEKQCQRDSIMDSLRLHAEIFEQQILEKQQLNKRK